jgi:hypothetical protein
MRFLLVIALLLSALEASGQLVANPNRLPERWKSFEKPAAENRLKCRIEPIQPRLNYGFRFQAGYGIELPLRQYASRALSAAVVIRVTPEAEEREPVWLVARVRIPRVPNTKATAEFGGAYLIGEGKYRVDMQLIDDQNRICVRSWNMRAKLSDDVREVRPGMPAGAVDDISLRRWSRQPEAGAYNVSVLVHAAAMMPTRVRLRRYDRMLLMSALVSMLERLPLRNVRLTIFSMDRQEEVYHVDELSGESFRRAVDALNALELGLVDYSTLKNRGGETDLVAAMINREFAAKDRPDAVVVLGPLARWTRRVEEESLPDALRAAPIYYVQLRPWRMMSGLQPDTITRLVRKLGGRTKAVYSPEDFAEAIRELERLLARREPSKPASAEQ